MIRINISLSIYHTKEQLINKCAKKLHIDIKKIKDIQIVRQSIDARHKDNILYNYIVDISCDNEKNIIKNAHDISIKISDNSTYMMPSHGNKKIEKRPIIIGFGPAGIFAGLLLAQAGFNPIILERGADIDTRIRSVSKLWNDGIVDTESNVSFGEGGAGTFSDGKLNTTIHDSKKRCDYILDTFIKYGADENIKYLQKPHIGSDKLKDIIVAIRKEIISLGGDIRFLSKVTDINISNDKINSIVVNEDIIECGQLIIACGHSARDMYRMLKDRGLSMTSKSFAVGLRIQHPQKMIDISQYGDKGADFLHPATYKLTGRSRDGRGVYSFCMCPGGYVVDDTTEIGKIAINGMSYHARDSINANSAIIVSVNPDDFGSDDILSGIKYQEMLEENAFKCGQGHMPVQLLGDFLSSKMTSDYGDVSPAFKGLVNFGRIDEFIPKYIKKSISDVMPSFGYKIKGFDRYDAILAGIESRTSAPIRINRDDNLQSNIDGIYPCGEGAGYAGGIMSAAADGMKVAEKIIKTYKV